MKNILIISFLLLNLFLQGQTIVDYQKIAEENNPGLQAKLKEFEASMQKVAQVSSLPDPNFSVGYFISPVETRVGPQRARLSLSQMFPWFGTLKAQGNVATLMAEAKYQSYLDARNKLYLQVANAFYPLYELKEWKTIEENNIKILKSYKSITTNKLENGNGSVVDVLRVDIMLKDAENNLDILNKKEKPLRTSFNKILNRNEDELVVINDLPIAKPSLMNYNKDSLINNPLLDEINLKIKASEAAANAARKQGLPKFGVGLDYVIVGQRTDMMVSDNGKDVIMPMVSFSIPIFRGKYKASLNEAKLMQESYALQRQEISNNLSTNYEMASFEIQQQLNFITLYQQQIEESKQILNLLFVAYGNSGKEFEELLRTQQQILKYEKMRVTALTQHQIALSKLNYITATN